jgi:hypothetical protein
MGPRPARLYKNRSRHRPVQAGGRFSVREPLTLISSPQNHPQTENATISLLPGHGPALGWSKPRTAHGVRTWGAVYWTSGPVDAHWLLASFSVLAFLLPWLFLPAHEPCFLAKEVGRARAFYLNQRMTPCIGTARGVASRIPRAGVGAVLAPTDCVAKPARFSHAQTREPDQSGSRNVPAELRA